MKIEEYKDEKNEHRIRLTADNGNIIYASTEGYKNAEDARQAAIKASIEMLGHLWSDVSLSDRFTLFGLATESKWRVNE